MLEGKALVARGSKVWTTFQESAEKDYVDYAMASFRKLLCAGLCFLFCSLLQCCWDIGHVLLLGDQSTVISLKTSFLIVIIIKPVGIIQITVF